MMGESVVKMLRWDNQTAVRRADSPIIISSHPILQKYKRGPEENDGSQHSRSRNKT